MLPSPTTSASPAHKIMLPLRKILCPVDFSEASLKALDRAAELALQFKAELCILHVVPLAPPMPPEVGFAAVELVRLEQEQAEEARRQLDEIVSRLDSTVKAGSRVEVGREAYVIVRAAEEGADLIVLSTHGRSGWKRLCYGSVTEKVLHHAPCPVLAIRQRPDEERGVTPPTSEATLLPLRTLLCPIDYSEASKVALGIAGEWARQFEARLDVLHVVPTISQELAPGEYAAPEYNQIWLDADREKLCQLVSEAVPKEIDAQPLVRLGDAAAVIERTAHEEHADILVLSTHGYGGLKHLVFGSVAEEVLRSTHVPMLIVRAPKSA